MNSKTCDNCATTAHEERELSTWIQVAGKGGLFLSAARVMDACSEPCGLAVVASLIRSRTENPFTTSAASS